MSFRNLLWGQTTLGAADRQALSHTESLEPLSDEESRNTSLCLRDSSHAQSSHNDLWSPAESLEVYRRSANFHLKEYLRFKEKAMDIKHTKMRESESVVQDLIPHNDALIRHSDSSYVSINENEWSTRVEKDSLIADLVVIEGLLEQLQDRAVEKNYLLYFLGLAVPIGTGLVSGPPMLALVSMPAGLVLLHTLAKTTIIRRCQSSTVSLRERTEQEGLDNKHRGVFWDLNFRILSWMNPPSI